MPKAIYHAYGYIKKKAAIVNLAEGILSKDKVTLLSKSPMRSSTGDNDQFPLYVWQTGSGTQTNMNVNEVLSNRATEIVVEYWDQNLLSIQMTMSTCHNLITIPSSCNAYSHPNGVY